MITLRPYQQRGVDEIRAAFRAGKRAPLYVLPTGGGKSIVLSYVGKKAAERGNRVMIGVHREELVDQLSTALDKVGCSHGLIHPDFTEDLHEHVQVASIDTLLRRITKNPARYRSDLFIQDEAHHLIRGNKWGKVIAQLPPESRLLGVTATAGRLSGEGLGIHASGFFDVLIQGPQPRELMEIGALVPPVVYAPPIQADLSDLKKRGGDYAASDMAARLDKAVITGDVVKHYSQICGGARAIVFATNREHSKHLVAQFRAAGYRAAHVDSETPSYERKQAVRDFAEGRLTILSNVELFGEGFDVPGVEAVIMVRKTASLTMFLQMCGRALRPAPGKTRGIIIDHVGNAGQLINSVFIPNHGMPDWDREWSLAGKDKKSKAANENEPQIRMSQCPQCYAAHLPALTCPACGHVYETALAAPKQVEGELQAVTPEAQAMVNKQRRREVGRAQTLEDLEALARERGYKPGWARFVYESRQKKRGAA